MAGDLLERTLHEWIEDQVDRTPDAPAVIAEEGCLTYAELEARANQLARHLRRLGVGPETRVGICAERSLDLMIGLLGILKSGGAYVSLDPGYPRDRLFFLLEDSAVPVLLTQERLQDRLPASNALQVRLDADREAIGTESAARLEPLAGADHLAYVIYTSGSTGRPKGAMNAHRGICNRLHWMQDTFGLGPDDTVLQKTPFSFDVSVWELFWPLMNGARLVMARPGGHQDAAYLADLIVRERVTTLHFVPPMLRTFLEEPAVVACAGILRRVICSGEALPVEVQRRFFARLPGVELHNLYGPTEAAVDVTWWPCDSASALATVPIGRPVANTRIHLLDPELRPVLVGEPGELYIGGVQVGRGYLNRPDLTGERFVPDPFEPDHQGARLYRTGDLARSLPNVPDGAVEFLGRIDFQVKIRGFRIELGEIEAALDQHPGVESSVVVAAEGQAGRSGDKRLVAYLRPDRCRAAAVRRWLALEREGRLEGQSFHELPDGTVVAHRGRGETEFLWEEIFAERGYLRHGIELRDGDCVFDVGANIGLFSLFAGREAAVRIHAFEPIPPVFDTLAVNAGLHGLDVRLHDYGLADKPGSAEFTYYPHASLISGRFADGAEEREVVRAFLLNRKEEAGLSEVQVEELLDERLQAERHACRLRTLSEVIAEERIERIDLLKVDVEKSELEVLAGLRDEDWPKVRQVVVEVHDIDGRLERALELLRRHGFEVGVEQDRMLTKTGLYNLYARRASFGDEVGAITLPSPGGPGVRPGEGPGVRAWISPGQLIRDVKAGLRERLPEHMVPSSFVVLEEFPLSPNGKVDRKALPAPESVRHAAEREHLAPRTPTEERLAAIWREILGTERIGSEDSFLEIGGHSLLAAQVLARVRDRMGVALSLRDVFECPVLSAFATLIDERGSVGTSAAPIVAVPRISDLPVSFAQERVWFLQQLDPTIQSYQFQARIRFRGRLDVESLRRGLEEIVARHEIFRTSFPTLEGRPWQRFHPAWKVSLPSVDLSGLPDDRREPEAERVQAVECRKPFAVDRLPLVRWTLIRLAPADHLWFHVEHHLVHDGWSFNLLVGELAVLYRCFSKGRPSPLPVLPLQFADWAIWQREWMRGEEARAQIEWWKKTLAARPQVLELPTDRPRPKRQSFRGTVERLEMPLELCSALRAASRREGVSLYMLMQAAFAALLSRWSGQEQVNVGSAVANRRWRESESMIGMMVDNVVLTNDLSSDSGDPTIAELLQRVRRVCLDAGVRQDVPFDHVVEAVQPERDLAYNPLFQASFSFHDSPLDELDFPGLEAELAEGLSNGSAKFDLNVICIPRSEQRKGRRQGGGITLLWEYATALFDPGTMLRMIDSFYRLLGGFTADPSRRVAELPMLSEEEERQLEAWSGEVAPLPLDLLVHQRVEAWADRTPEALAVSSKGRSLTYGELEAGANRLARRLIRLGAGPELRVGVCLEASVDLPLALLGVLKTGGAYLPLDPAHPPERLGFILKDSAIPVLITTEALARRLPTGAATIVTLDGLAEWPESSDRPRVQGTPANLAYVIYTSGSTGRPKGTELAHAGLLNLIAWHQKEYEITPADRTTQVASPAFDASVWEIWPTLAGGASLHLAPEEVRSSPADLLAWLAAERVTVCFLPTPLAEACLEMELPEGLALRVLLTGGDRLHRVDRRPFRLVNHYGPTEGTVVTTAGDVAAADAAPPIGRPIDNFRVHVLDRHLQRVPIGVPGELVVGGIGLARGYLERPELTAEKFIPNSFGGDRQVYSDGALGARLYRTGDLVRWRRDGRLDFVGRTDHQVKIRGFRIELGEIEGILREHPAVREAVAVVREVEGEKRLVAYLTPHPLAPSPIAHTPNRERGNVSDASASSIGLHDLSNVPPLPVEGRGWERGTGGEEYRAYLAGRLPSYMVPSAIVVLQELPLGVHGKVDRAALPAPEGEGRPRELVEPGTPVEARLAEMWADLLPGGPVGIDDGFFERGGHSLLATRLIARVHRELGVEVPLGRFLQAPTVAELARGIEEARGTALIPLQRIAGGDERLALSYPQRRLWFLDQLEPGLAVYNVPLVYRFRGALDVSALERSLAEIVRRHEILRTVFQVVDGEPRQVVLPATAEPLLVADVQEEEAERRLREESRRPFDLARGPLLRPLLLRLGPLTPVPSPIALPPGRERGASSRAFPPLPVEGSAMGEGGQGGEEFRLLLSFHHIVCDGWSAGVLAHELEALYTAFRDGKPSPLPELPIQYADFADWQQRRLSCFALDDLIHYWKERLGAVSELPALPSDRPRPPARSYRGDHLVFELPSETLGRLEALARSQRATLFTVLLATFCVFLQRHTGGDEVALGTPVANRGRAELEPLIGLFANTLVLRAELAGDPGFLAALERLRLASLDAIAHQELPFERLVEELQPDRDLSRNPLFDVLFSYREGEIESLRLPGLQVEPMDSGTGTAKFDLSLSVSRSEGRLRRLRLRLEYATDLFEPATAQRLAERLQVLLADVSTNPSRRISELALLSEAEQRQLLVDWNRTGAEVPESSIHELIERQAKRTPQAVALAGAGITWSYAELEAGANRLARHLQRLGVGPEVPVGIHLERSPAMVAAVLAVLKAGAAYLPLDPAYPADCLAFMLADSAAPVVITSRDLPGLPAGPRAIFLDDLDWAEGDGGRRLPRADASLAYVLYTSGSTGRPKGVQVTHRNVVNFFAAMDAVLGTDPGTWFAVTSLSFDISVLELLWTLTHGFRVVIPDEERRFSEQILEHGATHLQCTPSLAQALAAEPDAREALRPLRKLMLGGEALPAALAEDLAGLLEGELLNMYGPTETTVWSATHRVEAGRGAVPIGKPVANTTVYLLDPAGKPAPLGVPAELAIGGLGVTRGYLKRPGLTAERFVPDPFSSQPGGRLYRTGDLARWRSFAGLAGELEFLGRLDHQVKVRGHRIELGEVETVLERHPGVARAVVMAHDERLVAYVVGRQTPAPAAAELRDWVRRELPEAMVPSLVVELEALPLTPNGKIDRKALPAPEAARSGEAAAAPQGPLEELLASVWREMLGVDVTATVGREESFFELGGHSLLVMRIVARLRDVLGVEVSPRSFFEAPTVSALALTIERERREGRAPQLPPIRPVRPELREAGMPLSFGQQRLWFLDRLEPGRAAYQLGGGFRFLGPLDAGVLARALAEIVRRHESLRTRIAEVDGTAVQVVSPAAALPLPLIDLSALPEAGRTAAGLAGEIARLPFDLDRGPLLRSVLVRLAAQEHVLVLAVHHVVFDGGSLGVLAHELGRLYAAFDSGRPSPLPELPVQYADFAAWQRTWLQGEVLAEQITWWKEHLAGAPAALDLPADRPRPAMPSRRGGTTSALLGLESWKRLQEAGRSCGLTPFMTLSAVFSILLSRYSGQQDLVVGTPISGRRISEIEGLIGLFANTLALRTRLDADLTFTGLAKQVRNAALGAFVHQDLPFEKLVDELKVERDLSRSPLFQTLFLLQNPPYPYWDLSVPAVSPWPVDTGRVQFDLVLAAVPQPDGLEVRLHFDRDLFDGATATRMAAHFTNLLEAVGTPGIADRPVGSLPLMSPEERHELLARWNDTAAAIPVGLLHEPIEAQAAKTPEARAVAVGGESMTYSELNRRANRLARHLRRLGVGPEVPVGLCAERSADMLVGLLAALKSGGFYVPLDPAYPRERLAWVMEDAGAPVLLMHSHLREVLPAARARPMEVVELDHPERWEGESPENLGPCAVPENPAYAIYTSGSTGRPKGVQVRHRGAANFLASMAVEPGLSQGDVLLAVTTLAFDIALLELLLPLWSGACVVIASREEAADGERLAALLEESKATVMQATPATWRMLLEAGWKSGEGLKILCGGEALPRELAERLEPGELWNLYGPTETTVWSALSRVEGGPGPVPVGRPIANTELYVTDFRGEPVPVGVPGELWIGGAGLARGYLRRPDLTAERFRPDPISGQEGARLYRTGDLARWRPSGELELLGRLDHQVKIRGFRIELGEIEAVLAAHPAVRECAVVVREDLPGTKRLAAYLVPQEGFVGSDSVFLETLRETLPEYMVPQLFVMLPAVPLTPNGKIDRRALLSGPAPETERDGDGPVRPRNRIEEILAAVWTETLQLDRIGIDDNFFALGGDSVMVIQVASRCRKRGLRFQPRHLFQNQTVASLATVVDASDLIRAASAMVADPAVVGPVEFALAGLSHSDLQDLLEQLAG